MVLELLLIMVLILQSIFLILLISGRIKLSVELPFLWG